MQVANADIFVFCQVHPLFDDAEAKNKLLRSVAGGGMEAMTVMHQRWDKFELMMESHKLMIKEQVSDFSPVFLETSFSAPRG